VRRRTAPIWLHPVDGADFQSVVSEDGSIGQYGSERPGDELKPIFFEQKQPRKRPVSYSILSKDDLPGDGNTYEFQGYLYGNTGLSFIWVDMPPGDGVRLHKHPYQEIFIIQEGSATYTVGSTQLEARAGQVIIVPGGVPHKFVNSGEGPLRQI